MTLAKAAPNGIVAGFLLAFVATAGLFYVNIMQAIVTGLVDGLGFSNVDAGNVGAANTYGAAFGALIGVFLVRKVRWKLAAVILLVALISIDFASTLLTSVRALVPFRFLHGTIGGILVATGYSVMARTRDPDRTFGILLVLQYGLGGLGNMYLPRLVPVFGVQVLFLALAAFSIVTLLMLPFLDAYPAKPPQESATSIAASPRRPALLIATLVAIFTFQGANMGLGSYVISLGRDFGLAHGFVSNTVGESQWVGVIGAGMVVLMSTRFGRTWPLAIAFACAIAGTWLFHRSEIGWVFLFANFITSAAWAFVVPYLFGMCSQFDSRGYAAVLCGFFSKMGLATGIKAGGSLLGADNRYGLLIDVSVWVLIFSALATLYAAFALDRSPKVRAIVQER